MKKYLLEIIVFISGTSVMILEIVGSRVLAPYVGTSILIWSSLIGVILGCLSLGYWWGGKYTDKNPNYKTFSTIIFMAAIFIGLTAFLNKWILDFLQLSIKEIRTETIIAALVLFGPASFLMAAVSPYAVRLKIADLKHSGQTVGNLYAISTIGSIFGTFLTGFLLIPLMGNFKIILFISALMFIASLFAYRQWLMKLKIAAILLVILYLPFVNSFENWLLPEGQIHISSQYNDMIIKKDTDIFTGRPILVLDTGPQAGQSAMFLDKDDNLVFPYQMVFRLADHFNPDIKKSLIIGGAGYSWPKDYLRRHNDSTLDVVEIDPKMTEVAKQYFNLPDDTRLTTYNQDGRTFLNRTDNKYDSIIVDAFNSYLIPYQLTTKEAVSKMYGALNDNGAVLVNIISSIDGETGKFLRAEYATYKKIFPQVYIFPVFFPDGTPVQNIILVALKSDKGITFSDRNPELDAYLKFVWGKEIKTDMPILTDDYAPVDQYMLKVLADMKS